MMTASSADSRTRRLRCSLAEKRILGAPSLGDVGRDTEHRIDLAGIVAQESDLTEMYVWSPSSSGTVLFLSQRPVRLGNARVHCTERIGRGLVEES